MTPGPSAVIDLDALRHNVATLATIAAPARVMLAVKADAYGHGMLPVARAGIEAGATSLAVLEIPAALTLREAGMTLPLFAWLHGPDSDFRAAVDADVELGVSTIDQLERIASCGCSRTPVVHLKVDTGLSRNGATLEDWPRLVDTAVAVQRSGGLRIAAVWSHLADASVDDDEAALAVFHEATRVARERGAEFEVRHLAASSAGIRMPEARFDLVRFGIAAYGISPFDDRTGAELGLRPVMMVRAPVAAVEPTGDPARRIAVLPIGFADGVPPLAAGPAAVMLGGTRHRVVGVGVDSTRVDIGDVAVEVGAEATIFGAGDDGEPTAEDWAGWAETIGDEIVVRAGTRIPRTYVGE